MKIPFKTILFLIILSLIPLFSQEIKEKDILYSEYLDILREKLPELNRSTLSIESAENNILNSHGSSDINFSGSALYSRNINYSSSNPINKTESHSWYFEGALSKKFNSTGTTLETGTGYDYTEVNKNNYKTYSPSVYIGFSQSLLKNAFGLIDRFSENDARMKLEIERLRKSETDKSYLNYYKKLFFSWIMQREKLLLLKKSVNSTRSLAAEIERKVKSGLTDRLDIQSVRALLLQYELNFSNAETELNTIVSELSAFLNIYNTKPAETEFDFYYNKAGNVSLRYINYETTRSARIYRLTKKNLKYSADIQENALLPQLDVTGQYSRLAKSDNSTDGYNNLEDSEYYLGFSVTYPLQNSSGRASFKEAEIAVKSINNEYEITKKTYNANLNTLIIQMEGLKKSIELTEKRVSVLESKYSAGYRQYIQSRQNLQFLIDTSLEITGEKITLYQLKNSLIQYCIDYEDFTEGIDK